MTPEQEREAARSDPRQLELPLDTYRTKIDWKASIVFRDPAVAERIAGKSPVCHIFDPAKHPISF